MVIEAPGVAPRRCRFRFSIEDGAERGGDLSFTGFEAERWRGCGPALARELATRICKVRLASWADMEEDDD